MSELDKQFFIGAGPPCAQDVKQAEVRNFTSDVTATLAENGWSGTGPCSCIGLTLSADNKRVEKGTFLVRGKLSDEQVKIDADKIWPAADKKAVLGLRLPDGGAFTFSEAGLSSDLLEQNAVQHGFYAVEADKAPAVIMENDYNAWGFGAFCIRLSCVISKSSSALRGIVIKYTAYLFPESKENMIATYELAQSPAWPGMRLCEGEMPLLLRPSVAWGCPIMPLLQTGAPLGSTPTLPDQEEMRKAIATIINRSCVPETGRTGATLVAKWRKIANNRENLVMKAGPVTWPTTQAAAHTTSGKYNNLYIVTITHYINLQTSRVKGA